MGMYGSWLRVSEAELARAKDDLDWAYGLAERVSEAEDDDPPGDPRCSGTDKAWHALQFLLDRRDFPVSIVYGEESFIDLPDDPEEALDVIEASGADWGYGPPGYLTPAQVVEAAAALAELTEEDLVGGVDPAELQRAEIYPTVWDRPGELAWVAHFLPGVRDYFIAAAKNGDAVICWIS
ncbi:YfbM family protein [Micromonospora sp. WMMD812]|uniref:YfbM family protein n=1 Tax=Micromonospora sp. WMMD812 TaxID=3015152 RepID=UPI00248C147D|nr:YfbM family protein [Micromonospora sp. WMMD812]WBB68589.1 YfbM family protein [Micromonospora sp. WMMD812]